MRDSDLLYVSLLQRLGVPFTLNRASPQAQGLIGWWPTVSQRAKILYDYSGNALHGTFGTGAAEPQLVTDDVVGRAVYFDGTGDDAVNMGNVSALTFTSTYTFALWIKVTSSMATNDVFISKGLYNTDGYYLQFASAGGGLWVTRWVHYTGAHDTDQSAYTLAEGVWAHCVFAFDGSYKNFYKDGRGYTPRSSSPALTSSRNFYLGRYDSAGSDPQVYLSDVRAYNRALTAAEVASLYNPQTRWELYEPLVPSWGKAPAVAASSVPVFYHHRQEQGMS